MARSTKEITQAMKANFVSNADLAEIYGLDQSLSFDEQMSAVSVEALIIWIVGLAHHLLECLIEQFKREVDKRIDAAYLCSIPWYHAKCLEYQHGDSLTFDPTSYRFIYATPDEAKRIVRYAAVRQITDNFLTKLQIFVSKDNKAVLSATELTAFTAYIKEIGAAGIHIDVQSGLPDELSATLQVIYDPMVLEMGGSRLDGSADTPVVDAVEQFVESIEYGGTINRTKLIDAVQAVDGVVDVILTTLESAGTTVTGQNVTATYGSFSVGTLDITYTPNVEWQ